jgi:hypothetical protein
MLIAKRGKWQFFFCQNLPLGALISRSALSVLVGEEFKKFGLFLNTGVFGSLEDRLLKITSQPSLQYNELTSRACQSNSR